MNDRWVGINIDGLLFDPGVSPVPMPAMLEQIRGWIAGGVDVRILLSRRHPEEIHDYEKSTAAIQAWCVRHLGRDLPIAHEPDEAMARLFTEADWRPHATDGLTADAAMLSAAIHTLLREAMGKLPIDDLAKVLKEAVASMEAELLRLEKEASIEPNGSTFKFSPESVALLLFLNNPSLSATELARRLKMHKSAISRMPALQRVMATYQQEGRRHILRAKGNRTPWINAKMVGNLEIENVDEE